MIISRSPVRITLGGGGTDLASYYSMFEGALLAATINKYTFVTVHPRFEQDIQLKYSQLENCSKIEDIKHNIFREALKLLSIQPGLELTSLMDIPGRSGMGSSGSFTVALLNALHTYKNEFVSQEHLAEEACRIEINILKEPVGKQDQYICSFGGIKQLLFAKDGKVTVKTLNLKEEYIDELENNLLIFYTGITRRASKILKEQNEKSKKKNLSTLDSLHKIKEIGLKTKYALEQGDIDKLGEFLHEHWLTKKQLSTAVSNPFIDECYNFAIKNGALGGKIMGAGGGGFFMFYHNGTNKEKTDFIKTLSKKGLKKMRFNFDFEGAKILFNSKI